MSKEHTLRLQSPFGRLILFVVPLLLLYGALGEGLMRLAVQNLMFGIPSIGSADKGFEGRLHSLQTVASRRGSIDCVFFGDSTAMTDFAPYEFTDSLRDVTGAEIECFNFGVGAFSVADTAALAQIVVRDYSPQIVLIGIEALNFAVPSHDPGGADFAQLPWTRFKLGESKVEGWLYEHSALYRQMGSLRQVLRLEMTPAKLKQIVAETNNGWEDGYYPLEGPPTFDVTQHPDPTSDHPYHRNYFGSLFEFQLLPEHLSALDQILALDSLSTQVVLVEMPVAPTFFDYFGNGTQDYIKFVSAVEQRLVGTNVSFWRAADLELSESEFWFNYNHLTPVGAIHFSRWLGNQAGLAVTEGTLDLDADTDRVTNRR